MNDKRAILAVEDKLGEAVLLKILGSLGIEVSQSIGFRGKGYLQNKAQNLNHASLGFPVIMLTDQDLPEQCPPRLLQDWVKGTQHPNFFLRIAVMEIESWIMADRSGITDFLAIPLNRIPQDTDAILQPKEYLVSQARKSRKARIRKDIVPEPGATTKVGPGYNSRIGEFVYRDWDIDRACGVSNSLNRTVTRLRNL